MKVWLCTSGSHDTYMIHKIVDTLEKAETWLAWAKRPENRPTHYDADIEEWEVE